MCARPKRQRQQARVATLTHGRAKHSRDTISPIPAHALLLSPLSPAFPSSLTCLPSANLLPAACSHPSHPPSAQLALKLSSEPRWVELIGALPRLLATGLEGQLCGPPPPRPAAPGQLMGEEAQLFEMLQKMGLDGPGLVTG